MPMYSSTATRKVCSWLVAAALVVQPVTGFSCGCKGPDAASAAQPASQGCCCCGLAQQCCCCNPARQEAESSKSPETCCQHRAASDPAPAAACRCWSGVPAGPQSVPGERTQPNDLAASSLWSHVAAADAPAVHRPGWAVILPTAFASASEYCVALCRLLI
jgi:hypothetical protein